MRIVKPHGALQFSSIEAALRIEGLCSQSKKMTDGADLIYDFQSPFRAASKPQDGATDEVGAHPRSLMPCSIIVRQIA
jgi:hypothetical protein